MKNTRGKEIPEEVRIETTIESFSGLSYRPKAASKAMELYYIEEETATFIVEDRDRLLLRQGDLLLVNALTGLEILRCPDTVRGWIVSFPSDQLKTSVLHMGDQPAYLHMSLKNAPFLLNLMKNLILLSDKEEQPQTRTLISKTLELLLLHISIEEGSVKNKSSSNEEDKLLEEMLAYIETYFPTGSLYELSDMLTYPVYYLSRLLKKRTGYNFKELIMEQKLEHAASLLTHTTLPIDAIIESIGYNNSSFFFHVFRERYGKSPKQYRMENQK